MSKKNKNYPLKVGDVFSAKKVKNIFRIASTLRLRLVVQFNFFDKTVEIIEISEAKIDFNNNLNVKLNVDEMNMIISKMKTVKEIEKAIENETRKSVLEFAGKQIKELKK